MLSEEVRDVVMTYHSWYREVMSEKAVQSVIVFRNRGKAAGASLQHPHSQVIALEMVPPLIRARQAAMRDYYKEKGRCAICTLSPTNRPMVPALLQRPMPS